jgi:alanyl-tRNA synthetase
MHTDRLYYADPYLVRFTAQVISTRAGGGGRTAVALDRTAFYPTGGGQPHDTGALAGRIVVGVEIEDGLVWHTLEGAAPSGEVAGVVDWPRRFDHMQQHTGQHVLSQAFIAQCDAETVAFHLGAASSTIDLHRTDLSPGDVARAEDAANALIDAARPVTAAFVDDAELARLPLRKPPAVTGQIRIVQVQDFDWSACGGTHVVNTSQIGLIKITGLERRGPELRVSFLCGQRARRDYARLHELASGLAARFTIGQDEVPAAVERLAGEQRALRKTVEELEAAWVETQAEALWAGASPAGAWRLAVAALDAPPERVRQVGQALRARRGAVALLGARGARPQIVFARADDVTLDIGALLRTAVTGVGGKGGGRPDWAQGGAPDDVALETALRAAEAAVRALLT